MIKYFLTVCDNLHKMLEKSDFAFVEMAAVNEHKTHIDNVEGFDILVLDKPETEEFVLDEPPILKEIK